jgi:short-subunit dehydrogenase
VTDDAAVNSLWSDLAQDEVHVNVLVLNSGIGSPAKPLLELGISSLWEQYTANVKGPLHFAEKFWKQPSSGSTPKVIT